MPSIRVRSRLGRNAADDIAAYIRDSAKAIDSRRSHLVISEKTAPIEMAILSSVGRAYDPLWHIVISWPKEDNVDSCTALDTVERLFEYLGAKESLWIAAAHGDTDHRHVHALICRVDPNTHKTLLRSHALRDMRNFRIAIEKEHAWTITTKSASPITPKAIDAEVWNGEMSFMRWLQGALAQVAPTSWSTLDAALSAIGAARVPRKSGFCFVDQTTAKTYAVAASHVGYGPRITRSWGLPPPFQPLEKTQPSYGELIELGRLPSQALGHERTMLRREWLALRAAGKPVSSQFGKWLRRQAHETLPDTAPDETRRLTDLRHRPNTITLSASNRETMATPPPPMERRYAEIMDQYQSQLRLRLQRDRIVGRHYRRTITEFKTCTRRRHIQPKMPFASSDCTRTYRKPLPSKYRSIHANSKPSLLSDSNALSTSGWKAARDREQILAYAGTISSARDPRRIPDLGFSIRSKRRALRECRCPGKRRRPLHRCPPPRKDAGWTRWRRPPHRSRHSP